MICHRSRSFGAVGRDVDLIRHRAAPHGGAGYTTAHDTQTVADAALEPHASCTALGGMGARMAPGQHTVQLHALRQEGHRLSRRKAAPRRQYVKLRVPARKWPSNPRRTR
jgi:hypothetical protein